jgi:hypothetical protein
MCDHKLAWGHIRIECDNKNEHGSEHSGMLLQTRVSWLEGDRRDYVGEFIPCLDPKCILPQHTGSHAY